MVNGYWVLSTVHSFLHTNVQEWNCQFSLNTELAFTRSADELSIWCLGNAGILISLNSEIHKQWQWQCCIVSSFYSQKMKSYISVSPSSDPPRICDVSNECSHRTIAIKRRNLSLFFCLLFSAEMRYTNFCVAFATLNTNIWNVCWTANACVNLYFIVDFDCTLTQFPSRYRFFHIRQSLQTNPTGFHCA